MLNTTQEIVNYNYVNSKVNIWINLFGGQKKMDATFIENITAQVTLGQYYTVLIFLKFFFYICRYILERENKHFNNPGWKSFFCFVLLLLGQLQPTCVLKTQPASSAFSSAQGETSHSTFYKQASCQTQQTCSCKIGRNSMVKIPNVFHWLILSEAL